jgi:predicted DNA-binding ribbon-helix-helix protein
MKLTETTATLIAALEGMRKMNLDALAASAVDVCVLNYTKDRRDCAERVSVSAERFAPVRSAIIEALEGEVRARGGRWLPPYLPPKN